MTVHVWMRPGVLDFPEKCVYLLGKGESGRHEWAFRFRPSSSQDRPNQISVYHWNLGGGLGAGAGFLPSPPDDPLTPGTWYHVVAVFDPGDNYDTEAGVTIYKNGERRSFARYTDWSIYRLKGSAPLRIGTRSRNLFFTGGLDEVAIFDRKLTDSEIMQLYTAAQ